MTFEILGIDHVVLRVADLERAIAFYEGVLGAKVERRGEKFGLVQLRAGRSLIDLIEAPEKDREGANMDHFALRIEPFDEAAIRAHLEAHGIEAGELKTRYGAEGDGPSLYIKDPDGNTVELKGPPDGGPPDG
ncbi:MAG: VOC family protein [Proteobacteria bacterium]|nr:VOC family protein [Pseudomonadota bacterium]